MSNAEVVQSYVDAWNAHDAGRVAEHFSEGGIRHWQAVNPPVIGGPTRTWGREEIAAQVQEFMTAVPDLTVEFELLAEADWGAVVEWRVRGTHTGAWAGWTPQGEEVDFPGISIARISNGKMEEERMYFDPDMMSRNWAVPFGALMGVGMQLMKQSRATKKARAADASSGASD